MKASSESGNHDLQEELHKPENKNRLVRPGQAPDMTAEDKRLKPFATITRMVKVAHLGPTLTVLVNTRTKAVEWEGTRKGQKSVRTDFKRACNKKLLSTDASLAPPNYPKTKAEECLKQAGMD